jgi:hypothetical protein
MQSGHGKSAADGVGAAIKHYADNAVKSGAVIGNADQFFEWAIENNDTMMCIFVSHADVVMADRILHNAQAVTGLSKCHTVRAFNGHLFIRDKSCYQQCCTENPVCAGWIETNLCEYGHESENETSEEEEGAPMNTYTVGEKVEISYNNKVYGVVIEDVNAQTNEYEVKFMKKKQSGIYFCPKATWSVWVHASDILKVIK